MSGAVFRGGPFAGVAMSDAFAVAALNQSPVIVDLPPIVWPAGLAPRAVQLGAYQPGQAITGPVEAAADVLIILYTEYETRALLDVFTGDSQWTPQRRASWSPYAHNFNQIKPTIQGIAGDTGLEQGYFGYLTAFAIGDAKVVLYKSELHPKGNGADIPFIPVIQQLVGELAPKLVISTGTAGAIGSHINCGDVAITKAARFHTQGDYPKFPVLASMSTNATALTSTAAVNATYVTYAAQNFTSLSLPGLKQCFDRLSGQAAYSFLKPNIAAPFAPGTPAATIVDKLKATAGAIYGVYQYCTTLNSAFACWGVVAGLN